MKYFLALIALFFLFPVSALAAPESTCTNTYICLCNGGTGSNQVTQAYTNSATSIATCKSACAALAGSKGVTTMSYTLQCKDAAGTLIIPDGGAGNALTNLGSSTPNQTAQGTTVNAPATKPIAAAVIPILNVPIPGLDLSKSFNTDANGNIITSAIGLYIQGAYRFLLIAMALIAVVMLMLGGLEYVISGGSAKRVEHAKKRMTNAIIGLIILFAAYDIAFLLSPATVTFQALSLKNIQAIALEQEEDELTDPGVAAEDRSAAASLPADGSVVTVTGEHIRYIGRAEANRINPDVLAHLNAAADAYYAQTGKGIDVTSASRDELGQARLFYADCLVTGHCSPSACDPTGSTFNASSVVSYSRATDTFSLTGELAGVKDESTIEGGLASHGVAKYCPHTGNVAVDIWPQGDGGGFEANVPNMQTMMTTMIANGFCRLSSEGWHYELNSVKVDTRTCQTSYNTTDIQGHSSAHCQRYNFRLRCCTVADDSGIPPKEMCH